MDRTVARPLVIVTAFATSLLLGRLIMLWALGGVRGVPAPAAIGGPFQLTDQSGTTVTDKSLQGRPSLIFFGFDPHLKGLTGNPESVAKTLSAYRVYAKKVPLKDGDYTMDHTALTYLMDRDGKFVAPFNLNRTPEEAAADLKRYL